MSNTQNSSGAAIDPPSTAHQKEVRNAWARAAGSVITLVGAVWLFALAYWPILNANIIDMAGDRLLPAFGATILAFCVAVARAFVNFAPSSPSRLVLDLVAGVLAVGFGIAIGIGFYDLPLAVVAAGVLTYLAVVIQDAIMSKN